LVKKKKIEKKNKKKIFDFEFKPISSDGCPKIFPKKDFAVFDNNRTFLCAKMLVQIL
jgi:hypothetical protein